MDPTGSANTTNTMDDPPPMSVGLGLDLINFVQGVSRRNSQCTLEMCKLGISVLKCPGARETVLDYFSTVFHEAIAICIHHTLSDFDEKVNTPLEAVIIIGQDLCAMDKNWSQDLALWCIGLLKAIATKNREYSKVEIQTLEPVRIVMEIVTHHLMLLDDKEKSHCIDVLMIGSGECDWVVGSIARVQPRLVISRALQYDRDQDQTVSILNHLSPAHHRHVRNALLHLFWEALTESTTEFETKHEYISEDVDIDDLYEDVSSEEMEEGEEVEGDVEMKEVGERRGEKKDSEEKESEQVEEEVIERKERIIAYLINMATKSDIVLAALIQDIENTLSENVIEKLILIIPEMHSTLFNNIGPMTLVDLMSRADVHCFFLLLKYAQQHQFFRMVLEHLLQKLEFDCLSPEKQIPLLTSVGVGVHAAREMLLTGNQLVQYSVARLLILVGHALSYEFVNTISYLLQYSRSDSTLALLVRMLACTLTMHTPSDNPDNDIDNDRCNKYIKDGVEGALRESIMSDLEVKMCFVEDEVEKGLKTYVHHFCLNVITLLRWENSNKVPHLRHKPISKACESLIYKLGTTFHDTVSLLRITKPCTMSSLPEMPTAHALADVLDRLDVSGTKAAPPSVESILKLVQATVKYFFRCLHEDDILEKMQGTQTACRLLRKLCLHSKLARAIALRQLLETAMFREEQIFGSKQTMMSRDMEWGKDDFLLYMNQKQGPITQLTQSHTSVFHTGIIGKGAKGDQQTDKRTVPPVLTTNIELLMGALMSCMEGGGMVEGMTSVSLLLVELVSPDVMYNGLPWPDEDFTKQVCIERELYMVKALECCGVARAALRRAARWRPALCLTSALLRALAAAPKHTHDPDRISSDDMSKEQAAMRELLECMSLGQLLPYPLSHMQHLVPHLSSSEISQVLRDCVWNYTRDHVPSPALFTCDASGIHWRDPSTSKPSSMYTETLRVIIQKRISKLGHLYPVMFLHLNDDDEDEDEDDVEEEGDVKMR